MNLDVDLMRRTTRKPGVHQPLPITGGRRREGESHRICWRRRTGEGAIVFYSSVCKRRLWEREEVWRRKWDICKTHDAKD
jgi:hypothetical protein